MTGVIVSYEHGFVFLKTRKTGGTSVEIALSQHCGPGDVVTGITAADEVLRAESGGRGPQNDRLPARAMTPRRALGVLRRGAWPRAYNHMTAAEVKAMLPARVWQQHLKVSIERNPWDAVVSSYFWATRRESARPAFGDFLDSDPVRRLVGNWDVYAIGDEIVADHVCRYEDLADEMTALGTRLGLPAPLVLPRAKGGTRPKVAYQDLYDDRLVARVGALFARQVERFDYAFEAD